MKQFFIILKDKPLELNKLANPINQPIPENEFKLLSKEKALLETLKGEKRLEDLLEVTTGIKVIDNLKSIWGPDIGVIKKINYIAKLPQYASLEENDRRLYKY